jgi:hypothetical protein
MLLFKTTYGQQLKQGLRTVLDVIHGQGGMTRTGIIRRELRRYLWEHRNSLQYLFGEECDNNPGHTFVWLISPLPLAAKLTGTNFQILPVVLARLC